MRRYAHAVITGGSGLLGLALARALIARELADEITLCSRTRPELGALQELAAAHELRLSWECCDVQYIPQLQSFICSCHARRPLELLILNAGVSLSKSLCISPGSAQRECWMEDEHEIARAFATNAVSPAYAALFAVRAWQRAPAPGRHLQLAAISSLAALAPLSSPLYSATKSALTMHMLALAEQLRPCGISVTVVLPGFVKTAMSDRFAGPKPGMISADRAAALIVRGLVRERRVVAFPWYLHAGLRLLGVLPQAVQARLLRAFAFEVRPDADRRRHEAGTSVTQGAEAAGSCLMQEEVPLRQAPESAAPHRSGAGRKRGS